MTNLTTNDIVSDPILNEAYLLGLGDGYRIATDESYPELGMATMSQIRDAADAISDLLWMTD